MNDIEYQSMFAVEDMHWWYVSLHELIISYVAAEYRGKPLEILDAGCGTGRLCQLLGPYGNVTGIDASELALGFSRQRGLKNVYHADLNDVDLGDSRYDLITSIDVIYHKAVTDEGRVLAKFFSALKPGGMLILNLPAFEFLRSTHDIAVQTRRRYTRYELAALLARAGFVVEKSSYRIAFLFPLIALYRLCRKVLPHARNPEHVSSDVYPPSPLLNTTLLAVSRIENVLQQKISLPFGTSVFLVARRS
ncbi:methyltransferase domain-containing protein [Geobacter pelophilus]|uniref:Methyltransferase domain-containing protein n=1 Tax=Geoanaerobacter pelophilus TaxID=60036 RepID=A0AAW4L3K5_9BACT|nr:class I SAM-dependent methyltransferase [Geoanaerobacter pelophilus]MBT0665309.1 methyltransferase domain-containing protein [Geoanaerobacter pelophilus]